MKRRSFLAAGAGVAVATITPAAALAAVLPQPVLHVYKLNDYEWFIAPTLQAAIAKWKEYTGLGDEDLDDPHQLSEEDLDRLKFCHTDEDERIERTITFRERIAEMIQEGTTGADFFATTEY